MPLARALVRNSRIIICDEATSSIDEETDQKIEETMAVAFKGRTILCIAHRLQTILNYDRIAVIDGGRIDECGRPPELWERERVCLGACVIMGSLDGRLLDECQTMRLAFWKYNDLESAEIDIGSCNYCNGPFSHI